MDYASAPLPNLPHTFPQLQPAIVQLPWSPNILAAWNILNNGYDWAHNVLHQEADSICLRFHVEAIITDILPVLEAMESDKEQEGLSTEWLESAALALGLMVVHLEAAIDGANGT